MTTIRVPRYTNAGPSHNDRNGFANPQSNPTGKAIANPSNLTDWMVKCFQTRKVFLGILDQDHGSDNISGGCDQIFHK